MTRRALFELFGRAGASALMLRATRRLRPLWLTALAYHRVTELDPADPWDPDVISATPEMFRRQLEFLKRHFTPVSSDDIINWKNGSAAMPRNPVVLTFDDGYRDAHDVALPLLLEAGMRAEFFVCPWHIENRRLFWWDRIAFCLRKTRKRSLALSYPHPLTLDLGAAESADASRRAALAVVKQTRGLDIERFLAELAQRAEAHLDESKEAEKLLMSWEQVRALRRAGMGVGSHSYSHPILSLTDDAAARTEMVRSKAEIEAHLGEDVRTLAYPVGRFNNGTKRAAEEAGYGLAYSYCSGASFLRSVDLFEVRRVDVNRHVSLPCFRTLVAMPFMA